MYALAIIIDVAIHVKGKSRILLVWVSAQNVLREALRYEISSLPFYLSISRYVCLSVCPCVSLSFFPSIFLALSPTPLSIFFLFSYLYLLLYLPTALREYLCLSLSTYLSPSLSIFLFLSHPFFSLSPSHNFISLLSLSISRVLSCDVFFLNIFHLRKSSFWSLTSSYTHPCMTY